MVEVRCFIDPPADGAWNMAADEVLLEACAAGAGPQLRFYRWSQPTLSLGYFQGFAERARHPSSADCPVLRRASGGGALLHDREWTYSFAAPAGTSWAAQVQPLYFAFHEGLAEMLTDLGWSAELCRDPPAKRPSEEPFLCFQRRSEGDLLVDGWKIAGSAQRRRGGAVLQHGSLLLSRSTFAPELPGLVELREQATADRLAADFPTMFLRYLLPRIKLKVRGSRADWTDAERLRTSELVAEKYGNRAWTERR